MTPKGTTTGNPEGQEVVASDLRGVGGPEMKDVGVDEEVCHLRGGLSSPESGPGRVRAETKEKLRPRIFLGHKTY